MVKINKNSLFSHVPYENLITIKNVVDKMDIALNKHEVLSTDFLNPYENFLAKSILNKFDIGYLEDGGYDNSERKIFYIFPNYFNEIIQDKIECITIDKVENIEHKDVLGSLLALGIDRSKIGDIILSDSIYIFIKKEQLNFIKLNLTKIGKYNIKFLEKSFNYQQPEFIKKNLIVSSLRLDTFLSSVLNISRSKATSIIKTEKVNVNFKCSTKPSMQLSENDQLSIRGYGRIIFESIEKTTKKGNLVINIKMPK